VAEKKCREEERTIFRNLGLEWTRSWNKWNMDCAGVIVALYDVNERRSKIANAALPAGCDVALVPAGLNEVTSLLFSTCRALQSSPALPCPVDKQQVIKLVSSALHVS